jgi:hypothetical protein
MTTVVINGNTYIFQTDFNVNRGYLTKFPAIIQDVVTVAGEVQTNADLAQTAADDAQAAAASTGATATSSTSMALGTGTKSITVSTGKAFVAGQRIRTSRTSDPTNKYEYGDVTSYNSGTGALVYVVAGAEDVVGSGTHTDWSITVAQDPPNYGLTSLIAQILN